MRFNVPRIISVFLMLALGISLSGVGAVAETLNPEGINPHADAPRKRITQKQKQAAAEAMKKKKAEIAARKAAEAARKGSPSQNMPPAAIENSSDNNAK